MINRRILRKLQLTEVEILNEIDKICKDNSIEYFLIGGTLLGAIRHKGFIPWDDDIDIVMPRSDYEKFIKICKTQLADDYMLQSYRTFANHFFSYMKIRKKDTVFLEKSVAHMDMHHGIFVDIFPLDYSTFSGDSLVTKFKYKLFTHLRYQIGNKVGLYENSRQTSSVFAKLMTFLCTFYSVSALSEMQRRIISLHFNKKYFVNYGGRYGISKETMPVEYYLPSVEVGFEGSMYRAPARYHDVLVNTYGKDYMELPPESERVTHDPLKISFALNDDSECFDLTEHVES